MGKIKIDNNDNIDTDSSSNNISPPSYEVEELRDGSLYNRELNLIWPERPKEGYYSMKEYKKRKFAMKKNKLRYKTSSETTSEATSSSSAHTDDTSSIELPDIPPGTTSNSVVDIPSESTSNNVDNKRIFIGVHTASRIHVFLRPTQFVLYYRRPEAVLSLDDIPVCLPLMIGYMCSKGRIYHFGLKETYCKNIGYTIKVIFSDNNDEPVFTTLKSLVNHYEIYGHLRKNGHFEVFPIPD